MTGYYNEYPAITLLVMLYALLVLIKLTICLSHINTAARVMLKYHPELSTPVAYLSMVVGTVCVIPFIVLQTLHEEGWRFFLAYTEEDVERQMGNALND